mmetsp:Transcript_8486/g.20377  ORF Transcript_8486/g.20377 Transcript_8486/m.20377 type:complete len:130 (+) Transcript_8486:416-805(+)
MVGGYCLALDMTARRWQSEAKALGLPWTASKAFDTSLPHGIFLHTSSVSDPMNLTLWLKVNGVEKQRGNTQQMIWSIPELISAVTEVHTLEVGDLLLTGTPAGVGPVRRGDQITAGIEELGYKMSFRVE